MGKLEKIADLYRQKHRSEPLLVQSPGRVNIIGEHTDYNLGSVLPAAINKYVYLAIGVRNDDFINLYAADYSDEITASVTNLEPAWKLWPNYVLGVINEYLKAGKQLSGLNIVFGGDIPLAAGLSSSAAITCATAFAINNLFKFELSRLEIAKIAQAAEHNFVGVQCGLMDQFASLFGKQDHLIKLNCNTEEYEYIPFVTTNIKTVLFDTGVKHHLVSSAYNERRDQCNQGIKLVQKRYSEVKGLPDITGQMLDEEVRPVSEVIYKRCLYVIQEIKRLDTVCRALENSDYNAVGKMMFETHYGLKDLYEVSCDECDYLVDFTKGVTGVLGSRMMGAGFGGCTINLIDSEQADDIIERVKFQYKEKFKKELKVYVTSISNGTEEIKVPVEESID